MIDPKFFFCCELSRPVPKELLSVLEKATAAFIDSLTQSFDEQHKRDVAYAEALKSDEAFFWCYGWRPIVRAKTYNEGDLFPYFRPYRLCSSKRYPSYKVESLPEDSEKRHPVWMRGSFKSEALRLNEYWSKLAVRYLRRIRFTCVDQQKKEEFSKKLQQRLEKKMAQAGFAFPEKKAESVLFSSKNPGTHFTDYQWIGGKPYQNLTNDQLKSLGVLESLLPKTTRKKNKKDQDAAVLH